MLSRAPTRIIRDWSCDSRRWSDYKPRTGDVIIATAPKVGTTWMQQIVNLLIFQSPQPRPLLELSPWVERRQIPIETVLLMLEAQTHRRFLKSHLPLDALPIYDEVKYVHVARDGRDACMSFLNHFNSFLPAAWENFDAIGMADETIGRPMPRPPTTAREFFLYWIGEGNKNTPRIMSDGFFAIERSFWSERRRANMLLVHYNDLKADLSGEMKRIAEFLGIETPDELWPQLVDAASFEAMKRDGVVLMAGAERAFRNGHETFLHSGTNNRWLGVLTEADLELYERKLNAELSLSLIRWLREGRWCADDPTSAPD